MRTADNVFAGSQHAGNVDEGVKLRNFLVSAERSYCDCDLQLRSTGVVARGCQIPPQGLEFRRLNLEG